MELRAKDVKASFYCLNPCFIGCSFQIFPSEKNKKNIEQQVSILVLLDVPFRFYGKNADVYLFETSEGSQSLFYWMFLSDFV